MSDTTEQEPHSPEEPKAAEESHAAEESKPVEESKPAEESKTEAPKPAGQPKGQQQQQRPPREGGGGRPPQDKRPEGQRREGGPGGREGHGGGSREGQGRGGPQGGRREGGRPGGDDRRGGPGGDRGRFEGFADIDIEKLIGDPLYLDNQAHAVVSRMRDMDSGTRSQLRRLYNAVRRAVRAPESERQQQFVMLRARLAYTIARHSLRSLDSLEKLLLQVTRKNEAKGYERFRDLFEAIVAYNE